MGRTTTTAAAAANKETAIVAVVGSVLAGSVALFGLYYVAKRSQQATRRATIQCQCGKVKAEIYQPAANYKYAETSCIQCGCSSCVGSVKAVLKKAPTKVVPYQRKFLDPGAPTVLFYDSEIKLVAGKQHLEHTKLSAKTENRRVRAKCCGTPLAICPDHSYLNLVYCPTVDPAKADNCSENEVPFPKSVLDQPLVCFHGEHFTPDEQARQDHPNMKVISSHMAPKCILAILGRLLLLLGMGARGPGQGFPVEKGTTIIGIGYESIISSKQQQ